MALATFFLFRRQLPLLIFPNIRCPSNLASSYFLSISFFLRLFCQPLSLIFALCYAPNSGRLSSFFLAPAQACFVLLGLLRAVLNFFCSSCFVYHPLSKCPALVAKWVNLSHFSPNFFFSHPIAPATANYQYYTNLINTLYRIPNACWFRPSTLRRTRAVLCCSDFPLSA